MKKAALTPSASDRTIRQNLAKLRKPGVLTVRPGFEIANHQLTGRRAIVATVHTKTRDLPAGQLLPRAINRVPVDVRQATPHQRLRANDPAAAALTQTFGRPQDKEPTWPLERQMPSGQLLSSPKSKTQQALTDFAARQPVVAKALAAHAAKPKITYLPAPGEPLNPVQTTTTIIAHVSPDAGFTTLTSFLQGTKKSLVIGMYDFTSGRRPARFFRAVPKQDFKSAQPYQIAESPALTEAVADAAAKLAAETSSPPAPSAPTSTGTGAAKTLANISVSVTPLLTPDTLPPGTEGQYVTNMIKLIASAKKTLYVQLQYIEASAATGVYPTLLQAIAARVTAGVDVRLIESLEYGETWAEKMKDAGVDLTANSALQPNVHNKGFVIDSSVVVVSSQNFSPDGIQFNRDAGVIIESAPIAQYFENVFLADWNNKAKPFVAKSAGAAKPKPKPKAKPKKKRAEPIFARENQPGSGA